METPLDLLQQRSVENWLIGLDSQKFAALAQERFEQLSRWQIPPKILLTEPDPSRFSRDLLQPVPLMQRLFSPISTGVQANGNSFLSWCSPI